MISILITRLRSNQNLEKVFQKFLSSTTTPRDQYEGMELNGVIPSANKLCCSGRTNNSNALRKKP